MVNYYELLEISQDANRMAIEKAIKQTRRLWNNRANSPDASIRAEAEQHVREIAEAEKILLDDAKREAYNRELAQSPKEVPPSNRQDNGADENWEEEFFQAYNNDMDDYAAQIAQRAINADDKNGRAWFLYAEATRRCGNLNEAVRAFHRAELFNPNDVSIYRQLGFAYLNADAYSEAAAAFRKAIQLDPDDPEYHELLASCLRFSGKIKESLVEAKKAYQMDAKDDDVRFEYFFALYEDAQQAMSYNRSSGKHLITNKVQLDYVNAALKIMALTIPQDENKAKCMARMDEIAKTVVDAESKKGSIIFPKVGYKYNYDVSNEETRKTGLR